MPIETVLFMVGVFEHHSREPTAFGIIVLGVMVTVSNKMGVCLLAVTLDGSRHRCRRGEKVCNSILIETTPLVATRMMRAIVMLKSQQRWIVGLYVRAMDSWPSMSAPRPATVSMRYVGSVSVSVALWLMATAAAETQILHLLVKDVVRQCCLMSTDARLPAVASTIRTLFRFLHLDGTLPPPEWVE